MENSVLFSNNAADAFPGFEPDYEESKYVSSTPPPPNEFVWLSIHVKARQYGHLNRHDAHQGRRKTRHLDYFHHVAPGDKPTLKNQKQLYTYHSENIAEHLVAPGGLTNLPSPGSLQCAYEQSVRAAL